MSYCNTCGHQFSDVCGTCESLDGVPVKYSPKWFEIHPLKDDLFAITRNRPIYQEDCYWYEEWKDMNARIPFCKAGKNLDSSGLVLETCEGCEEYHSRSKRTNADKIRSMNDETLADFLGGKGCIDCKRECEEAKCESCWLDWLKQECE